MAQKRLNTIFLFPKDISDVLLMYLQLRIYRVCVSLGPSVRILDWTYCHWTRLYWGYFSNKGNLQECFRLCDKLFGAVDLQHVSAYSSILVKIGQMSLYFNLLTLIFTSGIYFNTSWPGGLAKWAIYNTILTSPKSWLSQEDLDAGCEYSLVPMDS